MLVVVDDSPKTASLAEDAEDGAVILRVAPACADTSDGTLSTG